MWGISFFMYEGVGSVLPVMEASKYRENFSSLMIGALLSLCTIHILFSELCYYYFGDNLIEPLVTEQFPQDNVYLIVGKVLFCFNILLSYPLIIYTTNMILEKYTTSKMNYSILRTVLKNTSRTIIVLIGVLVAAFCYYQLHKIFSFVGVVIGSFIVLITPALVHLKVKATTKYQRVGDYLIIIYAAFFAVGLGGIIIYNWDGALTGEKHK